MARETQPEPSTTDATSGHPTDGTTSDHTATHRTVQDHDAMGSHHDRDAEHPEHAEHVETQQERAYARFGGMNLGSDFFGWLVAVGVAILLTSIIGAVAAAIGESNDITQSDAERQAGTIGIVAAAVLLAVLAIGYYSGGYVAGRMSRFDGARQGLGVWLIGLVVTIAALGLGAVFGSEYNLLDRVDLPRIPLSTEDLGWGGLITAVAVVVLTLLAAMVGGKVGHRYHDRVDRAVGH